MSARTRRRGLRADAVEAIRVEARHSLGRLPLRRRAAIRLHRVWRRSRLAGPPKWFSRYAIDHASAVYEQAARQAEEQLPRRYRRALRGERMRPSRR